MRKSHLSLLFLLASGTSFAQAPLSQAPLAAAPAPPPSSLSAATRSDDAARTWFSTYGRCRNALRTQDTHTGVDLCRQAVDLAEKAGDKTPQEQIALLQSYETYGQALLVLGRGPEALAAENKAVDVAKAHLPENAQEYAMPFYWRALVESHFHDGTSASSDLSVVEESYRKAIERSPQMRRIFSQYLARILRQHADLLDAMGKTADGDKLRAEATKL